MSSMTSLTRGRFAAIVAAAVFAGGAAGVVISQLGVAGAVPTRGGRTGPAGGFMGGLMRDGGPMGPGARFGPGGRLLHGEATVAAPGGRTVVIRMQNGAITKVGGDSVTVRSSDGFAATYAVDKDTRISLNGVDGALTSLKRGDTVRVIGVVDGSTVRAKAVLDGLPDRHGMLQRWREHRPFAPMPTPSGAA